MSKLVAENDIKDEVWLTLPGETKVTEQPDANWMSASMFTLRKEDHTVANLLRTKLHTNNYVRIAAYKVPHPTFHDVEITVQTAPINITSGATTVDAAGTAAGGGAVPTPAEAVLTALDECIADLNTFAVLWEQNV